MSEIPKVVPSASTPNTPPADAPGRPIESGGTGFVTAGHAILFQDDEAHRCDVCASPLEDEAPGDDDDRGFDVPGRGLLVWSRGEERRYQEPPLCASCATAIGVSALQRWEIEEEEG